MMQRNLVYHLYPFAANDVWRWNLAQLRRRLDLFNGKRVIALALDQDTVSAATVKDCLTVDGIDWIELENDPRISESASWVKLWEAVQDEPGCTFRAHAKGVTPWEKEQQIKITGHHSNILGKKTDRYQAEVSWKRIETLPTRAEAVRYWSLMLYEALLDFWPLVEEHLERRPLCGILKQIMKVLAPTWLPLTLWPEWQYLGSFWWVRNRDFFARDWRSVPPSYYGVELWPGFNFKSHEAACLFFQARYGQITPMNRIEFTRDILWRKFQGWKRHHAEVASEMVYGVQ